MGVNTYLAGLNILVAFLGILFLVFTIYEFTSLRRLKEGFGELKDQFKREIYTTQRAMQRVIASYHVQDVDKQIEILNEAVQIDPDVFNGFNALGYAYLQKRDYGKAIDAFNQAIKHHPADKAGFHDLAIAHLYSGGEELCLKYLKKSIQIDPSSKADLVTNPIFEPLRIKEAFKELIH